MNDPENAKTPPPADSVRIESVQNGWCVFIGSGRMNYQGCVVPCYVFTELRELTEAVGHLLKHGSYERPAKQPAFVHPPSPRIQPEKDYSADPTDDVPF